ncbi:MAG: SpoIIE family protein phosphatase [Armatimonadota bacterium]
MMSIDRREAGTLQLSNHRPAWIGYAVVIALEIALTWLLDWIEPLYPLGHYPIWYVAIVMIAAYFFGAGPTIVAGVVGFVLFVYIFVPPVHSFWPLADTMEAWAMITAYVLGLLVVEPLALYARRSLARIQALADLLQRYELLFKHEKDIALFIRHKDGGIMEANSAAVEVYGYSRDELLSMHFQDICAPGIGADVVSQMEDAGRQGSLFETIHRRRDGSTFSVELSSQAATIGGDQVRLIIVRDITERKQAETALRKSERWLNHSQEIAHLGSWELDLLSNNLTWSDEAHRIFGLKHEEFDATYEAFLEVVHPDDREAVNAAYLGSLQEGRDTYEIEHRVVRKSDGEVRVVHERCEHVRDESGRIIRSVGMTHDITELVALRRQLENQVTLLQRALAPTQPVIIESCRVAAAYQAAFPGQDVGGDFYDVFATEDGRIAAFIGDVSGKGIGAASLAAAARSTIRAFAYELQSVTEALSHSNAVLCSQQSVPLRFVTALLVVFDPGTGRLFYASAGQTPAAVRRADGSVEFLPVHNPPLGVFEKQDFEGGETRIEPGDKLVLYTDGIFEARRDYQLFDLDGIERVLRQSGNMGPDELTQELVRAAREWAGGEIHDDVAVLIIERIKLCAS